LDASRENKQRQGFGSVVFFWSKLDTAWYGVKFLTHTENYDRVYGALRRKALPELLGTVETIDVEYKSEPYRLAKPEEIIEFVKDVCSMVNAEGGIIVIGIRTSRFQTIASEVATGQIPIKRAKFDAPQMLQMLVDHTFPAITSDQVEINFVEDTRIKAGPVGLVVIYIKPPDPKTKPTLIRTSEKWSVPSLIYARRTNDSQTDYPIADLAVGLIAV
jgi:hypothetical protein